MAKVSVIVPIYGVEKYIERCARSLFEQTLDDIEYLFIDDCTPDKSIEILKSVLDRYPHRKEQVSIHRMEKNSGQARVREWGMKNATGDYIIHCDSDDWVESTMYEDLYKIAIKEDADVVKCQFDRVYSDKHVIADGSYNGVIRKDNAISMLLRGLDMSSTCDKLVKRAILEKIKYPKNNMWEDLYLVLQMLSYSNKVYSVPNVYYHYCHNTQSICGLMTEEAAIKRFKSECEVYTSVYDYLSDIGSVIQYDLELDNLKMHIKEELIPYLHIDRVRHIWKTAFEEVKWGYIWNKTISNKKKLKYFLCDLGIYRFVEKIIRIIVR